MERRNSEIPLFELNTQKINQIFVFRNDQGKRANERAGPSDISTITKVYKKTERRWFIFNDDGPYSSLWLDKNSYLQKMYSERRIP